MENTEKYVYTVSTIYIDSVSGTSEYTLEYVVNNIVTAREAVKKLQDSEQKVLIERAVLDDIEVGAKTYELYDFYDGLEYKADDSDAEHGSLAMVYLSSSYYEVENLEVLREDIQKVINAYYLEMKHLGVESEIEDDIDVDEFLELDDGQRDHVLYHAESYNDAALVDFYKCLNNK